MSQQQGKKPKNATWSDRLSADIGSRIASTRVERDLSAQELSDSLNSLGHPLSRATISLIETGQRTVTAPDLVAISEALDVPIEILLFDPESWRVEYLPGRTNMTGSEAILWLRRSLPTRTDDSARAEWLANVSPLHEPERSPARTEQIAKTGTSLVLLCAAFRREYAEYRRHSIEQATAYLDDLGSYGIQTPQPKVDEAPLFKAANYAHAFQHALERSEAQFGAKLPVSDEDILLAESLAPIHEMLNLENQLSALTSELHLTALRTDRKGRKSTTKELESQIDEARDALSEMRMYMDEVGSPIPERWQNYG